MLKGKCIIVFVVVVAVFVLLLLIKCAFRESTSDHTVEADLALTLADCYGRDCPPRTTSIKTTIKLHRKKPKEKTSGPLQLERKRVIL